MRAFVRLKTEAGDEYELVHGDVIGRLRSAALHLDDGRVSEAHAMISLRDNELRLIALRGGFAVDGKPVREAALSAGLRVQLARGLFVSVLDVSLPDAVLGVAGDGLPTQMLPPVASFFLRPELRVSAGWSDGALAHAWSTGEEWSLRVGGEPARSVDAGDRFQVGSHTLRFEAIPLAAAGGTPTQQGGVDAPLRIVANFDTVNIHRDGAVVTSLSGVMARILSELVTFDGPVPWAVLAGQIWPRESEPDILRSRLDANLTRLRRRLRSGGVRTDLVSSDGAGSIELLLYPHDEALDRT